MTPPYIYEMRIKVRDYELDSEGIVNNANYLHYLEYTRHEFCAEAGLSFGAMRAKGMVPVVRRVDIEYLTPLGHDDEMFSRLWIERQGPKFVFHQAIFRAADEKLCVRADVTTVTIKDGRLDRGDELASIFAPYLSSDK